MNKYNIYKSKYQPIRIRGDPNSNIRIIDIKLLIYNSKMT